MLKLLTAPMIGVALGSVSASLLLAMLSWFGVEPLRGLILAYGAIGAGAGLVFGLTYGLARSTAEARPPRPDGWPATLIAVGFFLCAGSAVFAYWGWPAYRVLALCPATTRGTETNSTTIERWTEDTVTHERSPSTFETKVGYVYTVNGTEYAGSGESAEVHYDPNRPEVNYGASNLEGREAAARGSVALFVAGVVCGLAGVAAARWNREAWGAWLASVCLGAIAVSLVIGAQDRAVADQLKDNAVQATRHAPHKKWLEDERKDQERRGTPGRQE
jgi:hypothetical protein